MVTAGRPRAARVGARRAVSTGGTPRNPFEGCAPFPGEERVPVGASSLPIPFISGAPALQASPRERPPSRPAPGLSGAALCCSAP